MATADRLLSVLGLFTLEEPQWTIERAVECLGLSSSTAYRYFSSLTSAGLIEPIMPGLYVLGPAIVELDRQIRLNDPVLNVARPIMQELVAATDGKGIALLCRRYRQQVMCVHQDFAGNYDPDVSYERGRPMDLLMGAASRVILAHMPSRALKPIFTAHAPRIEAAGLGDSWDAFRKSMKQIRTAGVYVSRAQVDAGRVGISAPVFHPHDQVVGSLSIVLRDADASPQVIARVSTFVLASAREVDASLRQLGDADPGSVQRGAIRSNAPVSEA